MPGLRQEIAAEVAELKKKKTRFDRVSEDHQPWGAAFHTAKSPPSPPDETLPVDN
jgi:hypothetical protein